MYGGISVFFLRELAVFTGSRISNLDNFFFFFTNDNLSIHIRIEFSIRVTVFCRAYLSRVINENVRAKNGFYFFTNFINKE